MCRSKLMYRPMIAISLSVSTLLLGCTEHRRETPAFFSKKTGISLCAGAQVKNIRTGNFDYETDFIYSVRISAEVNCINLFYKSIKEKYGADCEKVVDCQFMSDKSWAYKIERIQEGVLEFTLNAI